MARRDELLELLRPPAHRGPLIAAGAVLFTRGRRARGDPARRRAAERRPPRDRGRDGGADPRPRAAGAARGREAGRVPVGTAGLRPAAARGRAARARGDPRGRLLRRLPGRRARLDVAAAVRRRALPGRAAQLRDQRDDRGNRARRRDPVRRELDLRGRLADVLPLAAARAGGRLRARVARAARQPPAARRADGDHGRPRDAVDRAGRVGRRAAGRVRRFRRRRRGLPARLLGARRARRPAAA